MRISYPVLHDRAGSVSGDDAQAPLVPRKRVRRRRGALLTGPRVGGWGLLTPSLHRPWRPGDVSDRVAREEGPLGPTRWSPVGRQ